MIREIIAVSVLLLLFAGFASAVSDFKPGTNADCTGFVDSDNDGLCDNYGTGGCDGAGCQKANNRQRGGCGGGCGGCGVAGANQA